MLIADRWELGPTIDTGGFGRVHRAFDVSGGPDVAVKLLHSTHPQAAERMKRSAAEVAQLEHPSIVKVIQVAEYDRAGQKQPALVMELVSGGRTLSNVIAESAPLEIGDAIELIRAMLDGLGHAHQHGIVHRDVKPDNILEDGETGRPKLTDFDLAKLERSTMTVINTQTGTPPYAAPELVNAMEATAASDLYSVGVILHELLSGTKSWCASDDDNWRPPSSENPYIPEALDQIVAQLTRRDPRLRLHDARLVRDMLRAFE